MSSSKAEGRGALGFLDEASAAFDPNDVLVREPGLLLAPAFLGALRDELRQNLDPEEAGTTLLQMGFLHGLHDAMRVAARQMAAPGAGTVQPAASPLPIQVRHRTGATGIVIEGCWPGRAEASVHLSRDGTAEAPACVLSAGYTSGWLSGILEADLLVVETHCAAQGHDACRFVAREVAAWLDLDDTKADEALCALPFDAMRELVAREVGTQRPEAPPPPGVDPSSALVHVWGPVMVIPFGGADEALAAVELIGRDPEADEVSVVIVDLSGAILDDAFGAVALERIIESVESWGGEIIVAGASSLSEPVLEGLDHQPLIVEKDLQEAVAAAFRIAESQRRTL